MTDPPTIGTYLREARRAAGLSQTQLARQTGIDQTRISGVENDRVSAYPALLDALVAALDLDPDETYAMAGRVPPDLLAAIAGNLAAIRKVRQCLSL